MDSNSKLLKDGSILFISTIIVNAGNYGINLILGRLLGPAEFSEVSLLVTLMLILSFFALGFQMTAAKFVAEYKSENKIGELRSFLKWLNKIALSTGFFLAFIFCALSVFWKDFFQLSSNLSIIIFGSGIPIYFVMSTNRGVVQGQESFKKLAVSYQVEMWSRFFLSLVLVYMGFGVNGVAIGLTLSLFFAYLVTPYKLQNLLNIPFDKKTVFKFFSLIILYECAQILINNSDTLIVKHYFSPYLAGLYGALALIGRIVYFGTWTVVTLLFPTVIKLEKEGKNHTKLFLGSLAIVAFIAIAIILISYFFPNFIVNFLFGENYMAIGPYLWRYGVATALFACANVFSYYNLSLNIILPVWLTLIAGLLQIALLIKYHADFEQIINIQISLMAVLFFILVIFQLFFRERKNYHL